MKIYIAGPITGYPDGNAQAFEKAKQVLKEQGYEPVSPADIPLIPGKSWIYYMRIALELLLTCEAAYFLKGWEKSKGASFEREVVKILEMPCWDEAGSD